jgi:hypothetical protein
VCEFEPLVSAFEITLYSVGIGGGVLGQQFEKKLGGWTFGRHRRTDVAHEKERGVSTLESKVHHQVRQPFMFHYRFWAVS